MDILIKNVNIFNRGKSFVSDIHIRGQRIHKVGTELQVRHAHQEIDGTGKWLIPGIIDDQVHFREPGLTHKADIASESRAAIAGGTTSFMEMPNTKPPALTQELLQHKYDIASKNAYCNYSFFMGVSNENYDEVMKTDLENVCGIKIFMGSSTGNMLVDNPDVLERIFANTPSLIATHCEDETTIRQNTEHFMADYGDRLDAKFHPLIRNEDACFLSSSYAAGLAKKYNTRLHILHLTTRDELVLFDNTIPLSEQRITSEVCVHHLHFCADDYETLGNLIKCNPAIKDKMHREALWDALLDDRLDIIATDHAPHTYAEKSEPYIHAPSGLPLVQHSLYIMLNAVHSGKISMEKVVEKMCHAPAECFQLLERGYLDEGKYADLVLIDPDEEWTIGPENIYYKCGWSPLTGVKCKGRVLRTFVNGSEVYNAEGKFVQGGGMRLTFSAVR
ncbi:MAG: dihydroorotase [Saprospiraceae bacterium]|nr:dihydroorotase [Saprospiraceae bacterium]